MKSKLMLIILMAVIFIGGCSDNNAQKSTTTTRFIESTTIISTISTTTTSTTSTTSTTTTTSTTLLKYPPVPITNSLTKKGFKINPDGAYGYIIRKEKSNASYTENSDRTKTYLDCFRLYGAKGSDGKEFLIDTNEPTYSLAEYSDCRFLTDDSFECRRQAYPSSPGPLVTVKIQYNFSSGIRTKIVNQNPTPDLREPEPIITKTEIK